MPIVPLPQFEADLAELERERRVDALAEKGFSRDELAGLSDQDLERFEKKRAPKRLVVRFGDMKMVGEFPYNGDVTPGCGSKMVVTTHRGTELGEMLTSTCPNAGCSKSVSRKEMLEYIKNSGGRDYPFFDRGRVLRVATTEDLDAQARADQSRNGLRAMARDAVADLGVPVRLVDVEPILGGERVTFYITSEDQNDRHEGHHVHDRVDLRGLTEAFSRLAGTRVDVRQVGARDEARLVADYEKCGQYCCCKNFLKVLKPVSMRSAKTQRGTLDPLKISGRCGRLMCCLRYEDETYEELRRRLPKRGLRVGTPEGDGEVVDAQILTQLAMVRLDSGRSVAIPVEELEAPGSKRPPRPEDDRRRRPGPRGGSEREGARGGRAEQATGEGDGAEGGKRKRRRRSKDARPEGAEKRTGAGAADTSVSADADGATGPASPETPRDESGPGLKKKRRRRRRSGGETEGAGGTTPSAPPTPPAGDGAPDGASSGPSGPSGASPEGSGDRADAGPARKKRRRRRRRPGPEGGADAGQGAGGSGDGA